MTPQWIYSEGGPYLCTTQRAAAAWQGVFGLSLPVESGRYAHLDRSGMPPEMAATDYGYACARTSFAWRLPGPVNDVMIVGDTPDQLMWRPLGPDVGLIVKWFAADSEAQVMDHLRDLDDKDYTPLPFEIAFREPDLVMFDSAADLQCIGGNKLAFVLEPGVYSVHSRIYDPADDTIELHLLKLRRERDVE